MSFLDWLADSARRYRELPPGEATKRSAMAFAHGGIRRVDKHIGKPIWHRGDWDVLVVLDACRVDLWQAVAPQYDLPVGGSVWSNASCSIDWIDRNFNGHPAEAAAAGYVSANPFTHHETDKCQSADLLDGPLPYVAPLYRTHWQEIPNQDNPDEPGIMTVPPEPVTDYAIKAWRERESLGIDRLVIHYLQPHEPYISRPEWGNGNHRLFDNMITDGEAAAGASIWPRVRNGQVPMSDLWDAMAANLEWVLDDVAGRLLKNIDGQVVLSSDHGNALGELGEWHHPPGAIGPAVRKVPWVRVDCNDLKTVTPSVDLHAESKPSEDIVERLQALGYA